MTGLEQAGLAGASKFKGRIVGECRSNPMEHLFSFDHTTGEGRWLYER